LREGQARYAYYRVAVRGEKALRDYLTKKQITGRLQDALVGRARDQVQLSKFSAYIFKPGATHGKDTAFTQMGYSAKDSRRLSEMWRLQAEAKVAKGDYALGKADQHGQRIDVEIELPGVGSAQGTCSYMRSGWILHLDGRITLNTPFSGYAR